MLAKKIELKPLLGMLLLVGATSAGLQISVKAENSIVAQNFDSENILAASVDHINQFLPMMVDEDTRWDSSVAGPGKMVTHNYTLINHSANNVDGSSFGKIAHNLLTQRICQDSETIIYPKEGVYLNFNYYDRDRILISRVQVSPSDCGY